MTSMFLVGGRGISIKVGAIIDWGAIYPDENRAAFTIFYSIVLPEQTTLFLTAIDNKYFKSNV